MRHAQSNMRTARGGGWRRSLQEHGEMWLPLSERRSSGVRIRHPLLQKRVRNEEGQLRVSQIHAYIYTCIRSFAKRAARWSVDWHNLVNSPHARGHYVTHRFRGAWQSGGSRADCRWHDRHAQAVYQNVTKRLSEASAESPPIAVNSANWLIRSGQCDDSTGAFRTRRFFDTRVVVCFRYVCIRTVTKKKNRMYVCNAVCYSFYAPNWTAYKPNWTIYKSNWKFYKSNSTYIYNIYINCWN